jgi:hypothetical protein
MRGIHRGVAGAAWAAPVLVLACAHAGAPTTTAADWRPADDVRAVTCDDAEPLPEGPADAGTLRVRCAEHFVAACSGLADQGPLGEADLALVRRELEPGCRKDPRCGCARLGHALLAQRATALEAATLLDGSCHRGALDACDDMLLQAEVCAATPAASPLCKRLRAQGRLPEPERTPPAPRTLPPTLARCFVVLAAARDRARCGDASAPTWFQVPSRGPSLTPGTVICVERDRWSMRPTMGRWNQRLAAWAVDPERDRAIDTTSDLVIESDGARGSATSNCTVATLGVVDGAWIHDAHRIARVEDVCGRMRRCVAAVTTMFPPAGDATDAPAPELPDDLLGCAAFQAQTTKLVPQPPPECE